MFHIPTKCYFSSVCLGTHLHFLARSSSMMPPIEAEGEIIDMTVGNLYGKESANVCAMNDAITWLFGNNETEIFVSLHHK